MVLEVEIGAVERRARGGSSSARANGPCSLEECGRPSGVANDSKLARLLADGKYADVLIRMNAKAKHPTRPKHLHKFKIVAMAALRNRIHSQACLTLRRQALEVLSLAKKHVFTNSFDNIRLRLKAHAHTQLLALRLASSRALRRSFQIAPSCLRVSAM